MKNVKKEKLNKLRQRNVENAYLAIDWLEKNRNLFKGVVYEPMFLLVSDTMFCHRSQIYVIF